MSDKADKFNLLHSLMIETLMDKIKSGTATAADLSVARQFLKDNNIDCTTKAKPELEKLAGMTLPSFTDDPRDMLQ